MNDTLISQIHIMIENASPETGYSEIDREILEEVAQEVAVEMIMGLDGYPSARRILGLTPKAVAKKTLRRLEAYAGDQFRGAESALSYALSLTA